MGQLTQAHLRHSFELWEDILRLITVNWSHFLWLLQDMHGSITVLYMCFPKKYKYNSWIQWHFVETFIFHLFHDTSLPTALHVIFQSPCFSFPLPGVLLFLHSNTITLHDVKYWWAEDFQLRAIFKPQGTSDGLIEPGDSFLQRIFRGSLGVFSAFSLPGATVVTIQGMSVSNQVVGVCFIHNGMKKIQRTYTKIK